jgi:hypothetical protein
MPSGLPVAGSGFSFFGSLFGRNQLHLFGGIAFSVLVGESQGRGHVLELFDYFSQGRILCRLDGFWGIAIFFRILYF